MDKPIPQLWRALHQLAREPATSGRAELPPLPKAIRARIWEAIAATAAVVVINALLTRI